MVIINIKELVANKNILIIGDFNSSAIWDNEAKKEYTHTEMVEILEKEEIVSIYHELNNEKFGKEKNPTLFFQRNKNKPYHIDYCFCKKEKISSIEKYWIGKYDEYILFSDHMPMMIQFKEEFGLPNTVFRIPSR